MQQTVAYAVLFLCCLCSSAVPCSATELSSSWLPIGQARIQKNVRAAIPFRPEQTLEQNNQNLREHRSKSVIVSSTVPTKNLSRIQLVNQPARLQLENRTFSGRVTAVVLSEDKESLTVFAEIAKSQLGDQKFSQESALLLSVDG